MTDVGLMSHHVWNRHEFPPRVGTLSSRAAAAVSAAEPSAPALCAADVRLVFAGRELRDGEEVAPLLRAARAAGGRFGGGGPPVVHMAVFRRSG